MDLLQPAEAVFHPALEGSCGESPPTPFAEAGLTDRRRLAAVLQGAALLAHLEHAGWHLPEGWRGAGIDGEGRLRVAQAVPGRGPELTQELLAGLLLSLFGARERVAGRGEARRAARRLLAGWKQGLAQQPPDLAVTEVLTAAPFLWEPPFAGARRALVGEHRRNGQAEPWVAGPGRWRGRLLALAGDRQALEDLVAGEVGRELWPGGEETEAADGSAGKSPEERLAAARRLFARGRFERALDHLSGVPAERAAVVRLRCHYHLGQLGAARSALRRLKAAKLPPAETVAAAEAAVRVLTAAGDRQGARRWVERASRVASRGDATARLRAELLAAEAAWDRGDAEEMEARLEAARGALAVPGLAWRWHHAAGLRALAAADGTAAESLARALAEDRRGLTRFEAAGLWNDLGVARAQAGELGAAERAFLHALRLQERCDGPRKLTLALHNLAEIRLRRGRPRGVREILERTTAANRQAGNLRAQTYDTALWARFELLHGRPEAALALCREALAELDRRRDDGHRSVLQVLAARALGWLGRSEEAAEALAATSPESRAELEPEERAPLWAHAGQREWALSEAAGDPRTAPLFQALLTARPVPASAWGAIEELEPFRAARLVFDCELLSPGAVPAERLRHAVATLRRLGAGLLAERLEARDTGPWRALETYLAETSEDGSLAALFAASGYPAARLWWESEERSQVLVDGEGGGEELAAPLDDGRLVLTAPVVDATLRALFRLALRDHLPESAPRRPPAGGMVGESAALRRALERLDRLAASELPILVCGESGTGKELAAEQIHRRSPRAEGPWVAINCAALSETLQLSDLFGHVRGSFTGADRDRAGIFETAHGGTVFLDEIGDLPATAQGMLLRVLQEGEVRRLGESLPRRVDVRLITATHCDLEEMVRAGRFRQDLFYRLRGASVTLPPLRDRGGDILLLADFLLERQARRRARRDAPGSGAAVPRLSPSARSRLLAHDWPGNVRELEYVLGTAAALAGGGPIEVEHLGLPETGKRVAAGGYHAQVEAFRRRLVIEALEAADGSRAEAARRLGLSRQALSYLVRALDIDV